MRNGCGFSGGGSSTKACAWDEYINSGLFYVLSSAWVVVGDLGGRCRVCEGGAGSRSGAAGNLQSAAGAEFAGGCGDVCWSQAAW
jgi:hypothetical protein